MPRRRDASYILGCALGAALAINPRRVVREGHSHRLRFGGKAETTPTENSYLKAVPGHAR
jgi:hypothetical protein